MSDYGWKTKKEKILENARKDPFLKIEDLAKRANTTSRYVRTILSEANISLMELRKEYARNMENNNRNINDKLLLNYIKQVPFVGKDDIKLLNQLIFNNPQDFDILKGNLKKDYFHQSYLHVFKDNPWCISTLFVDADYFHIREDKLSLEKLFIKVSNCLEKRHHQISNIDVEIELATDQISEKLNLSSLSPVFRIKQTIEYNGNIVALMLVYFNSKQVSLSLSVNNGLIINRKGMVG